jgi:hypothetical protein
MANFPLKLLKSPVGISIAGVPWALCLKFFPEYWILEASAYIGYCFWVNFKKYDTEIVDSALLAFLDAVGIKESDDVRCCIYVASDLESLGSRRQKLQMISHYMPDSKDSTFIKHCKYIEPAKGIVGRAFTDKKSFLDMEPTKFSTTTEYEKHLSSVWRFSDEEVQYIDKGRKILYAIPIFEPKLSHTGKERCIGVLYLDSSDPQLPVRETALLDRMEGAVNLVEPLLRYMKK